MTNSRNSPKVPQTRTKIKRLTPPRILERVLHEARDFKNTGRSFLAAFDLDSTLFDLTLRVATIIDGFAADPAHRNRFPLECEALKKIQILRTDWGINEALDRINLTSDKHPEFCKALHDHWVYCFFSNDFLHCDQPLPGAVEFVNELRACGADIMYLTGRDVPRMLEGTEQSLRNWKFPLDDASVHLVLKPEAGWEDARFKVDILQKAQNKYQRIWLFENEPVNLNLVARDCPTIGLIFIESTHSGREQVADTLDRILHFEVDLAEFRKYKGEDDGDDSGSSGSASEGSGQVTLSRK